MADFKLAPMDSAHMQARPPNRKVEAHDENILTIPATAADNNEPEFSDDSEDDVAAAPMMMSMQDSVKEARKKIEEASSARALDRESRRKLQKMEKMEKMPAAGAETKKPTKRKRANSESDSMSSSSSSESDSDDIRYPGSKFCHEIVLHKKAVFVDVVYKINSKLGTRHPKDPAMVKVFASRAHASASNTTKDYLYGHGCVTELSVGSKTVGDPELYFKTHFGPGKTKMVLAQATVTERNGFEGEAFKIVLANRPPNYTETNGVLDLGPKNSASCRCVFYCDEKLETEGLDGFVQCVSRRCKTHKKKHQSYSDDEGSDSEAGSSAQVEEAKDVVDAANNLTEPAKQAKKKSKHTGFMESLSKFDEDDFEDEPESSESDEASGSDSDDGKKAETRDAAAEIKAEKFDIKEIKRLVKKQHRAEDAWDHELLRANGDLHFNGDSNSAKMVHALSQLADSGSDDEDSGSGSGSDDDDNGASSDSDDSDRRGRGRRRTSSRPMSGSRKQFQKQVMTAKLVIERDAGSVISRVDDQMRIVMASDEAIKNMKLVIKKDARKLKRYAENMEKTAAQLKEKQDVYATRKDTKSEKNKKRLMEMKESMDVVERELEKDKLWLKSATEALTNKMVQLAQEEARRVNWINVCSVYNMACAYLFGNMKTFRIGKEALLHKGKDFIPVDGWETFLQWLETTVANIKLNTSATEVEELKQEIKSTPEIVAGTTEALSSLAEQAGSVMKSIRKHPMIVEENPLNAMALAIFPSVFGLSEGLKTPGVTAWQPSNFVSPSKFSEGDHNMLFKVTYVFFKAPGC